MKKIFLSLIIIIILCLSACNNYTNEVILFKELINSENISADCYLIYKKPGIYSQTKFMNLVISNDGLDMTFPEKNISLTLSSRSKALYYRIYNANLCYYGRSQYSIEESEIDTDNIIRNIEYSNSKVTFELDIRTYLKKKTNGVSYYFSYAPLSLKKYVKCTATINNRKIQSIEFDASEILDVSYDDKYIFSLQNIKYKKFINKPTNIIYHDIKKDIEVVISKFSVDLNSKPIVNTEQCYLYLNREYYAIELGGNLKLDGNIYSSKHGRIEFDDCIVKYEPKLDLNKKGITEYNVRIRYKTNIFTKKITINVYDFENRITDNFDLGIKSSQKVLLHENYFILFNGTTIYKYDLINKMIVGKLNTKYMVDNIYIKGNHLYVSGHESYYSDHLPESYYNSSIYKINFSDFTIIDVMDINCIPNSFIVDNRDNIIISKKISRNIHSYIIANFDTKKIKNVSSGIAKCVMVYHPDKDAILLIGQSERDAYWNFYSDGSYDNRITTLLPKSSILTYDIIHISNDNQVILSKFNNEIYVSTFLFDSDYLTTKFNSTANQLIYKNNVVATYDNGKVYCLTVEYTSNKAILEILDIKTNIITSLQISVEDHPVDNIYIYNDQLYVLYNSVGKVSVIDIK